MGPKIAIKIHLSMTKGRKFKSEKPHDVIHEHPQSKITNRPIYMFTKVLRKYWVDCKNIKSFHDYTSLKLQQLFKFPNTFLRFIPSTYPAPLSITPFYDLSSSTETRWITQIITLIQIQCILSSFKLSNFAACLCSIMPGRCWTLENPPKNVYMLGNRKSSQEEEIYWKQFFILKKSVIAILFLQISHITHQKRNISSHHRRETVLTVTHFRQSFFFLDNFKKCLLLEVLNRFQNTFFVREVSVTT